MPPTAPTRIVFEDVVIDVAARRLVRGGVEQPLEPKAFAVLALLAGSPGLVFPRDRILDAVWGHRHVTPGVLNRVMSLLRQALGEHAHAPQRLHTVHGVGYRFDLPATAEATSASDPAPSTTQEAAASSDPGRGVRRPRWRALAWGLPMLALLALGVWRPWLHAPSAARATTVAMPPAAPAAAHGIAVLPFVNASRDPDQQFFSDGLSDSLIDALSRFDGLRVIGRQSAFRFRGGRDEGKAVAAKLGVAYLLDGSVQHAGDVVRISASLTKADDGSTVWAAHYDRPYEDLFRLEDDVAQAIATALHARLLSVQAAERRDGRPPGGDMAAYDAYLRGMQAFYRDDMHAVVEHQQRATRLDPRYAAAWAQLGIAWTFLGADEGWGTAAAKRDFARAHDAIDHALRLSPELGIAHGARGNLLFVDGIDWHGALAELERGVRLAPHEGQNQGGFSRALASAGRLREAIRYRDRFLAIEPLFPANYQHHAQLMIATGRLDEAERDLRILRELDPAPWPSHRLMAIAILRGHARVAMEIARAQPARYRVLDIALAAQIDPDPAVADAALARLVADDGLAAGIPYRVAQVHALRGDAGQALQWLERAWAKRDPAIHELLYDPLLLRFRRDPRLVAFCARIGLPPPDTSEALDIDRIRALQSAGR